MSAGLFLFLALTVTLWDGRDGWAAPIADDGRPCPMPLDPLYLKGQPIGMYHCEFCGSMVIAGVPHVDYAELARVEVADHG